jgi:hypothetical protein
LFTPWCGRDVFFRQKHCSMTSLSFQNTYTRNLYFPWIVHIDIHSSSHDSQH